jgi:hypothetical protein
MRGSPKLLVIAIACALVVSLGSLPAEAQSCAEGYGTVVVESYQGTTFGGGTVQTARRAPGNALGEPDRVMFSLGFGGQGYIIVDLGAQVGPKLTVFENSPPLVSTEYVDQATWDECGVDDGYPLERAAVSVSADLVNWVPLGFATNKTEEIGPEPPDANIHPNTYFVGSCFRYVKIVDASDPNNFCNSGHDNFDVDAVYGWDDTLTVEIDVKPQSFPNCFNVDGHGVIPVAILGSETFDVTSVDTASLTFNGAAVQVRGKKDRTMCHYEDVSGDFTYPEGAPDGFVDLVCQFEDDPSYWVTGATDATLTGTLLDGTPIEGTDSVCITQPVE